MVDSSISIIIPAYNVEKYLKAALDSITEQTELPDEVILIDDGSTDDTLDIARAFVFPVPYQVVSIENGGQGNARNLGISLASSEYVYFFDSDDLLTSNFVRSVKEHIRKNAQPDIVLFSGESFNDSKYKGNRWIEYRRGFSGVFSDRVQFLDKAFSHGALFCSPCLYVSKRSLWGAQGLQFGRNYLEDEALFLPVIFSCSSYVILDEVFFLRRNRHGSTMTMEASEKHVSGALNCMETTLRLYSSMCLTTRERWHVRKRLGLHCTSYIVTARQAGLPISLRKVFGPILKCKSLGLAILALLYLLRADQIDGIRKFGKALKRVGKFY